MFAGVMFCSSAEGLSVGTNGLMAWRTEKLRLAGLDFETANRGSGSICAAGCALVESGAVADCREWRLCPPPGLRWMLPEFTAIHGLSYWDVRDCPEFPDVWPELLPMLLSADCVIIHNAPFDLGHLRSVLRIYQLSPVAFQYADSLQITRQLLPEMHSHRLDAVARQFGIAFQHHKASEDAAACAMIIDQIGLPPASLRWFQAE